MILPIQDDVNVPDSYDELHKGLMKQIAFNRILIVKINEIVKCINDKEESCAEHT